MLPLNQLGFVRAVYWLQPEAHWIVRGDDVESHPDETACKCCCFSRSTSLSRVIQTMADYLEETKVEASRNSRVDLTNLMQLRSVVHRKVESHKDAHYQVYLSFLGCLHGDIDASWRQFNDNCSLCAQGLAERTRDSVSLFYGHKLVDHSALLTLVKNDFRFESLSLEKQQLSLCCFIHICPWVVRYGLLFVDAIDLIFDSILRGAEDPMSECLTRVIQEGIAKQDLGDMQDPAQQALFFRQVRYCGTDENILDWTEQVGFPIKDLVKGEPSQPFPNFHLVSSPSEAFQIGLNGQPYGLEHRFVVLQFLPKNLFPQEVGEIPMGAAAFPEGEDGPVDEPGEISPFSIGRFSSQIFYYHL